MFSALLPLIAHVSPQRMPARSERSLGSLERRSISRLARRYLWYVQDTVVNTLGSAPAASWLYKAQFLEAAAAMVILPIHLVIFLAEKPRLRPGHEIWLLCLMPVLFSTMRLPLAYANYCRCRLIIAMGLEEERLVGALLAHFCSQKSRWSCAVSAVLLPWYFCNILWCLAALPCSQYSEMFFWEMAKEAAPCEAFNFTSSFLCCLLTMTFCSRLVMPLALRIRWTMLVHARLQDFPSPGLSDEQLELISSSIEIMGVGQQSIRDEPTCPICLEPFTAGERMRRLYCTHGFHQECVDSWLKRIPTCPLRCPIEIPNPTPAQRRFTAQHAGDRTQDHMTADISFPAQEPDYILEPTLVGRSLEEAH